MDSTTLFFGMIPPLHYALFVPNLHALSFHRHTYVKQVLRGYIYNVFRDAVRWIMSPSYSLTHNYNYAYLESATMITIVTAIKILLSGITFGFPSLIFLPILRIFGFGVLGPSAG
jgi:hypothetical protein